MSARPERRQTTAAKARVQKKARDRKSESAGLKGIINALAAGVGKGRLAQRIRRASHAPTMTPQELMQTGYALLVATLADENVSPETRARMGLQILVEQRKVLEKWKLADVEPARIQLEWVSAEECEAAEDDLESAG